MVWVGVVGKAITSAIDSDPELHSCHVRWETVMTRTRASASLAIATAVVGSALPLTLTTPIAHGDDPLGPIRGAANGARAQSPCGALNYSIALEGEAQADAGNRLPGVPPAGTYNGSIVRFFDYGDPEADAINKVIGLATAAINDCKYKDYGVGFLRDDRY